MPARSYDSAQAPLASRFSPVAGSERRHFYQGIMNKELNDSAKVHIFWNLGVDQTSFIGYE
jgi:hypothetical protein